MFDWENLRHFLAVARSGTLSGAARSLRVDHATVSRRLAALETELQTTLVERLPRSCRLTAAGIQVFEQSEAMEAAAFAIARRTHAEHGSLHGKVTLSAPPVLVTHFLALRLADFRATFPGIQLSVTAEPRLVSLSRRESDVALRLVRPNEPSYVTRKIGQMPFGLYASPNYPYINDSARWAFIAYDEQFVDMPLQRWLIEIAGKRPVSCELSDISSHLTAARAGAGIAGLPCFLGDEDTSLVKLDHEGPVFSLDIWLVTHRDLRRSGTVRAVMSYFGEAFTSNQSLGLVSR